MAVGEKTKGGVTSSFPTSLYSFKVQSELLDGPTEDPTKAEGRDANAWSAEGEAVQAVLGASPRGLVEVDPAVPDCDIGAFRTIDGGALVIYAGETGLALTGGAVNYIYLDLTAGPPAAAAAASWPVTAHVPLWVWDDSGGSPVEADARTHLGSVPIPPNLTTVLSVGNETSGLDIELTAGDVLTAPESAADADGADVSIVAPDGGAHTSGDPDGGDVILTPGALGSGGAGSDGKVVVRLPGGTPGTDEAHIRGLSSGGLELDGRGAGVVTIKQAGTLAIGLSSSLIFYKGVYISGSGTAPFGNASNYPSDIWGKKVTLPQISAPSPASNAGLLYAKDISGTAEVFTQDEAGNETQLSCHRMDGPGWLYDESDPFPRVLFDCNYYSGICRYTNESRKARLFELLISDPSALAAMPSDEKRITHTETFSEHNSRLNLSGDSALSVRDWKADQAENKKRRDAEIEAWKANGEGSEPQPFRAKEEPQWMKDRKGREGNR